jgi:type I restriction-modification system DNA methylase subunit
MTRMPSGSDAIKNHAAFIWSVADLLRGDYKQSEYGKVILPLTVLRRFDCVLAPVKQEMLDSYERLKGRVENFGLCHRDRSASSWSSLRQRGGGVSVAAPGRSRQAVATRWGPR